MTGILLIRLDLEEEKTRKLTTTTTTTPRHAVQIRQKILVSQQFYNNYFYKFKFFQHDLTTYRPI